MDSRTAAPDELRAWIGVATAALGLVATGYMVWKIYLPEHVKDGLAHRFNRWLWKLGADERRKRARNRLVFDLREISDACECELAAEVSKIAAYSR